MGFKEDFKAFLDNIEEEKDMKEVGFFAWFRSSHEIQFKDKEEVEKFRERYGFWINLKQIIGGKIYSTKTVSYEESLKTDGSASSFQASVFGYARRLPKEIG